MGGIVARAYLRRYGGTKLASIMTLGAPHHGSVHAWLFAGACLAQLRPGNSWLAGLNESESAPGEARIVSSERLHDA